MMGSSKMKNRLTSWRRALFVPLLAGATLKDRAIACVGALLGISLAGMLAAMVTGGNAHLPLIVAPIGASAVLLFAVPTSPLAQPWAIIGGNTISALVGVTAARLVPDPALAIGVAVSLAIAAMSLCRCLHPPGGAAALTAVIGGKTVLAAGFLFPFLPVALNSCLLVALGWVAHKLSRQRYPHVAGAAPANTHRTRDLPLRLRVGFQKEDVEAALEAMHASFDISRADLDALLRQVELQFMSRRHGQLSCAEVMSRDVVKVGTGTPVARAQELLLTHNVRVLPVEGEGGRLVGVVGLRELARLSGQIGEGYSAARTARPEDEVMSLLPVFTEAEVRAVVIVNADRQIVGLVTQTDLLNAIAHGAVANDSRPAGSAAA